MLGFYKGTYESSRMEFLEAVRSIVEKYQDVVTESIAVPSRTDNDLFMDVCYIPARRTPEQLLIISSGVHGVEGFVGSAIQRFFMTQLMPVLVDKENTGVLFIHAVNPYGFKHARRVTENNIDLNRNLLAGGEASEKEAFSIKNDAYADINDLFNPQGMFDGTSAVTMEFPENVMKAMQVLGMPKLLQAVLQGQYDHPEGLLYGGKRYEPQKAPVEQIMKRYLPDYQRSIVVDLHTGYGRRGDLHIIASPIIDRLTSDEMHRVFADVPIEEVEQEERTGDPGTEFNYYTVSGPFEEFIYKVAKDISPQHVCIPLCFEYGTVDSHEPQGMLRTFMASVNEAQAFKYGYVDPLRDKAAVEKEYREIFYPEDPAWRIQVMERTAEVLSKVLREFQV